MADQRTRDDSSDGTLIWIAAGAAVGLIAGALVAERLSGRELTLRSLFDRGRTLATRAAERWEPLVEAALGVRDAWDSEVDEEDETALDARVLVAFSNDPVLAIRDVEIESGDDDTIVLHGRVHTAREVAHAVTIARGVPGVAAVRQFLSVRDRR